MGTTVAVREGTFELRVVGDDETGLCVGLGVQLVRTMLKIMPSASVYPIHRRQRTFPRRIDLTISFPHYRLLILPSLLKSFKVVAKPTLLYHPALRCQNLDFF
ncbi:MAG: hypothetical protein A2Y73_00280 [Chloroflexi bacterium RBG_13_56_8]|nr:MAG: hypothetical protein A2Y73_00280 [Chloroflexi bacterium RBG_13_56_8]